MKKQNKKTYTSKKKPNAKTGIKGTFFKVIIAPGLIQKKTVKNI